jgi:hypothetical protein
MYTTVENSRLMHSLTNVSCMWVANANFMRAGFVPEAAIIGDLAPFGRLFSAAATGHKIPKDVPRERVWSRIAFSAEWPPSLQPM